MSAAKFKQYLRILGKIILEKIEEAIFKKIRLRSRIEFIFETVNQNSSSVFTYTENAFQEFQTTSQNSFQFNQDGNVLILMQGLISDNAHFEKKSIKHYLNLNEKQEILISTWDDLNSKKLEDYFKDVPNVRILYNKEPLLAGLFNINFQITNTRNGLKWAIDHDFEFTVKLRTDQCMMHPRAIMNLKAIYTKHNKLDPSRILVNSLNTFFFRPYGASDMFQFGKTQDLLKYWSAPIDERDPKDYSLNIDGLSLREIAKMNFAETYLGVNYLKAHGIEPDYTLGQSLTFIKDFFVVLDMNVTEMFWNKYSFRANRWPNQASFSPYQEIDYSSWLALDLNMLEFEGQEYLLDLPVFGRDFKNE